MTSVQSSLVRSSEEVMRSYIGQRVEQYSFAAQPILVGTLTNIGRIGELYCFAGEGVWGGFAWCSCFLGPFAVHFGLIQNIRPTIQGWMVGRSAMLGTPEQNRTAI